MKICEWLNKRILNETKCVINSNLAITLFNFQLASNKKGAL